MSSLKEFISKEAISGILLMLFALLALLASNSAMATFYHHFLDINFSVQFGNNGLSKPVLYWINDGLMAIFFLLVGLELKREICTGELSEYNKSILPIAGAIGGMLIPSVLYYFIAMDRNDILHAWAIPMATDIAFALGILALFGKRVPVSLKLFLMTLAIIDDLGAIIVIGLFHTANLSWEAFFLGLTCLFILFTFNKLKVSALSPYLLVGVIMWICVLKSGFHATMAGVLLAMTIPMNTKNNKPMLTNLEYDLHSMVAFFILPLFAFANAGVPLNDVSIASLNDTLIIAIVFGLFFGKITGIFSFTYMARYLFKIESTFTTPQLLGVAALCGIGFTMSLFIAGLSFGHTQELLNISRLAILLGSLISMIVGTILLHFSLPRK